MKTSRRDILRYNQLQRDRWVESLARHLPAGTRILDLGAGTGRYRKLFAHCDYKAQDFGQYTGTEGGSMPEKWEYTPLPYVCDAAAVPAPDGSFDCVLCTELLEHVPEPVRVLKEVGRLLRPAGHAYISAPLGSACTNNHITTMEASPPTSTGIFFRSAAWMWCLSNRTAASFCCCCRR